MPRPSRRPEQIAERIRVTLAEALARGTVRDPRVSLVTISSVDVTRDLGHATVWVLPHGDAADQASAVEGLRSAGGYLRRMVAHELTTRSVPELHFELDRGLEHAHRIDQLLAEIRRNDDAESLGDLPVDDATEDAH